MFAIYNNGSVKFRSTSDNLYSIDKVDEAAESRFKPDDELYQNLDNNLNKKNYNKKALDSYKKIAKMDTNEAVYHINDIMTKEFISIDSKSTINEAYNVLKENKISQIPVVTFANQIVSIINKKMILNLIVEDIDNARQIMQKKIDEIYLPELITTDPISDIRRVAKVMIKYKIDAIPVVNQNNTLVGIVSKTDIIKAVSHIPNFQLWA